MEEIDIVELLKRVKEEHIPQRIQVNDYEYEFLSYERGYFRKVVDCTSWIGLTTDFDLIDLMKAKIKILDKPIIEELDTIIGDLENPTHNEMLLLNWIRNNRIKINEIIDYIRRSR